MPDRSTRRRHQIVTRKLKYQHLEAANHQAIGHERDVCPTPWKFPFVTRKRAKIGKRNTPVPPGEHVSIYKCRCGAYHLGKSSWTREQARTAWK